MFTHSLSNCYKKLMVLLLLMCTEILSVIVKCQATKKEFISVGICLSFFMTYCSSCKKKGVYLTMLTHCLSKCYKKLMVLLLLMCTEILSVIVKCQPTKKEFILVGICLSFFMTYCSSCKKKVAHLEMITHSLSNCYKRLMVILLLMCTEIFSVIIKCQATKKEFILVGICLSFLITYCSSCKKRLSTSQCLPTLLVIDIRSWWTFYS